MSTLDVGQRAELEQLVKGWAAAIRRKDVIGILEVYSPEVVSFDLVPPMEIGFAGPRVTHATMTDGPSLTSRYRFRSTLRPATLSYHFDPNPTLHPMVEDARSPERRLA